MDLNLDPGPITPGSALSLRIHAAWIGHFSVFSHSQKRSKSVQVLLQYAETAEHCRSDADDCLKNEGIVSLITFELIFGPSRSLSN